MAARRAAQTGFEETLRQAKQALRKGDKALVRRLAQRALRLNPASELPWLLLAAASKPRPALEYAQKALAVNPQSGTAKEAVRWLSDQIARSSRGSSGRRVQQKDADGPPPAPLRALASRRVLSPAALAIALLVPLATAVWLTYQPAGAQQPVSTSIPLAKATMTPTATPTSTPTPTPTPTPPTPPPPPATPTPTATPTPRWVSWNYITDPQRLASEGRWIDVDISQQRVRAYEGAEVVRTFIVSTGTYAHPTVLGMFRIYVKYRYDDMAGPGYYLPDVPYTMYFYKGYGLHGTYWHSNFGHRMSHGCINLRTEDAKWLFSFASIGTLVNIHP
jgi:lipoprotein-anchoring transpeptidase ErfK/SrfK